MANEEKIKQLEETKEQIIKFINDLDEKKRTGEYSEIEYDLLLAEKLKGKTREELINYINQEIALEQSKVSENKQFDSRKKIIAISATVIILIIIALIGLLYTNPDVITGYITAIGLMP